MFNFLVCPEGGEVGGVTDRLVQGDKIPQYLKEMLMVYDRWLWINPGMVGKLNPNVKVGLASSNVQKLRVVEQAVGAGMVGAISADIDEEALKEKYRDALMLLPRVTYGAHVAVLKAEAVAAEQGGIVAEGGVLLTSDSVVVMGSRVWNRPTGAELEVYAESLQEVGALTFCGGLAGVGPRGRAYGSTFLRIPFRGDVSLPEELVDGGVNVFSDRVWPFFDEQGVVQWGVIDWRGAEPAERLLGSVDVEFLRKGGFEMLSKHGGPIRPFMSGLAPALVSSIVGEVS